MGGVIVCSAIFRQLAACSRHPFASRILRPSLPVLYDPMIHVLALGAFERALVVISLVRLDPRQHHFRLALWARRSLNNRLLHCSPRFPAMQC
jgi:hypothetical protein